MRISSQSVYASNFFVPGVGYYHAPFRRFFPRPYNFFDPILKRYFYGGQWGPAPFQSIVNISSPMDDAANQAEALRTDVVRGGFGSSFMGGFG